MYSFGMACTSACTSGHSISSQRVKKAAFVRVSNKAAQLDAPAGWET